MNKGKDATIATPPDFGRDDVELVARESLYRGYFRVDRLCLRHRLFDGGWSGEVLREVVDRGEAVGVLPYDPGSDSVCLVRQFRVGMLGGDALPWPWEIVAGMLDVEGESHEACARRELVEESGIQVRELHPIYRYWVSPGGTTERMHLFCGIADLSGVEGVHGNSHENEDIHVSVMSRAEAMARVERGEIDNAATLISLLWLDRSWRDMLQAGRT